MHRWSPPQAAGTAVRTQPEKALYSTNHHEPTYQNGKEDGRVSKDLEQVQSKARLGLETK